MCCIIHKTICCLFLMSMNFKAACRSSLRVVESCSCFRPGRDSDLRIQSNLKALEIKPCSGVEWREWLNKWDVYTHCFYPQREQSSCSALGFNLLTSCFDPLGICLCEASARNKKERNGTKSSYSLERESYNDLSSKIIHCRLLWYGVYSSADFLMASRGRKDVWLCRSQLSVCIISM